MSLSSAHSTAVNTAKSTLNHSSIMHENIGRNSVYMQIIWTKSGFLEQFPVLLQFSRRSSRGLWWRDSTRLGLLGFVKRRSPLPCSKACAATVMLNPVLSPLLLAVASALRVTGWHHDPVGIKSSKQNECSISLFMVGRKFIPDSILPSAGQVIGISSYVPRILKSQLFWLFIY